MLHANGMKFGLCMAILVATTACAPKAQLTPSIAGGGPDEFSISPAKALEAPTNFASLPVPTPGGANLTDATPKSDAIVALGGRAPTASGRDGGIVTYASRYGVAPNIRGELSKSDERFLKMKTAKPAFPWTKNKYERAYRRLALDPWAEQARLIALGVLVPSAPPKP
ncbi:DUF3035 domain-containing protein [Pacificibacter marinus]|uniref:Beta-barrel assembly machine subunit BamF n=1 Tax=Pacificibacter marinus TaxID=658057 RepID=A0A1Y5TED1_9RHOB|nr:DUF3035 domain-containing protein [Pacificibacter marinus]SEL14535.1 Beta-barrel assembly machine subunit BamF [Pacificibacter marinus]SLN62153.1 hypothetical protein PAM7971_03219 [Pacificibacter marinus]